MSDRSEQIETLLDDIDEHDADLTKSELEFVESVTRQFRDRGWLTDPQINVLEDFIERLDNRSS